ncbi:hypothetical protein M5689_000439 [Euphorbia peplus]|nr:hypothetical protein M5689_000439 [Euphorbia peplus]
MAILSLQIEVEARRVLQQDFAAEKHLEKYASMVVYDKAKNSMAFWFQRLASEPDFEGNKTDHVAHSPLISQNRKQPSRSSIFSSFFTTAVWFGEAVAVWG